MALKVGELYATLRLDNKDFKRQVENSESAFSRATSGMKKAAGLVSLAVKTAMASTGAAFVGFGIKFNAAMEQSQVGWATLLGGADKAKKMISDLQKFGAETPFEFEGLDKTAKTMVAMGFDAKNIIPTMRKVGDAVAAVGGDQEILDGVAMALGQMVTKGKVSAEEMNQLAERGIPAWDLMAKAMGMSKQQLMDMASKGKILADDAVPKLIDAMGNKFKGAMDNQSRTWNGLVSSIKDNLAMLAGQLTKPLFDYAKTLLPTFLDVINKISQGFASGGLAGAVKALLPPDAVGTFESGVGALSSAWQGFKEGFINGNTEMQTTAGTIFAQIGNLFGSVRDTVMGIIQQVLPFLAKLWTQMKQGYEGMAPVIQSFLAIATEVWNGVSNVIHSVLEAVLPFIMQVVTTISKFWQENGAQIAQAVTNAFNIIKGIISFVMPFVQVIIESVWNNIKGVIMGALNVIMGLIKVFAGIFTGDFSKVWEGIKNIFSGAIEFIWNLFNLMFIGRLVKGIGAFIKGGVALFKSFVGAVKGTFSDFFNNIINLFGYFRSKGLSIWQALTSTIRNIVSTFKNAVVSNFKGIWSNAVSIFNKVKNAITNPIETAKKLVRGALDDIKAFFRNLKLKFPHIKTPHFKIVNWSPNPLNWIKKMPKIDISWYKKGGIFNGPSIIGVGEAGNEAVVPLQGRRMQPFADAIAKQLARWNQRALQFVGGTQQAVQAVFYLDGKKFATATARHMDTAITDLKMRKLRPQG